MRPKASLVSHLALALLFAFAALTARSGPADETATPWVGTWATAPFGGDPWHKVPTLVDSTLRQIVHTSIAGQALRVRFTNEFGVETLRIDAATVALSAGESAIQQDSLHVLTFGGQPSIVIPPGAQVISDVVNLSTSAFADLSISLYLPRQQISSVSAHSSAQQTNYIQTGNQVTSPRFSAPVSMPSWYFLKGVDVRPAAPHAAAVVAFGDSITDGAYASENKNHRWPDYLAMRLHSNPGTAGLAVLNEGIGGNCVLVTCVGPNALARFDRDVLAQSGVRYLIVLESIDDIGRLHDPHQPDYRLSAQDLEQGFLQLVGRAHARGIKVIAATVTPYQGAGYFTERGEQIRHALNTWILTSGAFDGTVDFDKATRDPNRPTFFSSLADSGDHLHPKDDGYKAMADAFDLSLFQ
jgi:lysophospholipase L1-like esterase